MTPPKRGIVLEARVQRLFLALGVHAERGLPIRTGRRVITTATDVDVLAVSYAPNFHRSVFHAECKGGHSARAFDRVFWLAGVRKLLGADRSLLVIGTYDEQSSEFARGLDVETLHLDAIRAMEQAYQIPRDWWPARSDVQTWDPLVKTWGAYTPLQGVSDDLAGTLRTLFVLAQEEGWRVFSYGLLDRVLSLLHDIGRQANGVEHHDESLHVVRLAVSCGLVRLSHYLLGICRDLIARQPAERVRCLSDRLTFGDQGVDDVRHLVERAGALVRAALAEQHLPQPAHWDVDHLLRVPQYQPALLKLVQRLMRHPEQAIYLPYATEMSQFGSGPEPRGAIEEWAQTGRPAVDGMKAFVAQALGVPPSFLAPPNPRVLSAMVNEHWRRPDERHGHLEQRAA